MKIQEGEQRGTLNKPFKLWLDVYMPKGAVIISHTGVKLQILKTPRVKRNLWQTAIFYLSFGTFYRIRLFYLVKRL